MNEESKINKAFGKKSKFGINKKLNTIFIILILLIMFSSYLNFKKDVNERFISYSKSLLDSTAMITTDKTNHKLGDTGFIIREDGYILTANHVVEGSNSIKVKFLDSEGVIIKEYPATWLFNETLADRDIAILKIKPKKGHKLKKIKIASKEDAKIGSEIGFIGIYNDLEEDQPIVFRKVVNRGIVSGRIIKYDIKEMPFYTLNIFSYGGYSGGPVFLTSNGKVISIIKGGPSRSDVGQIEVVLSPPIFYIEDFIGN